MAATDAPTRPLGNSGVQAWATDAGSAAWASSVLEHVPDLQWPTAVTTYARMRHDPTIRSCLAAYRHPITSARWAVDPRGADPRIVQLVCDSLGLPKIGTDRPGPTRRRGVRWVGHLRSALSVLTWGHAPFEPVWEVRGGDVVLSALPPRPPHSLTDILVDPSDGTLKAVRQANNVPGRGPIDVEIPADRLLWYVHDPDDGVWTGTSLLRHAYGPWLFKTDSIRVQATAHRRFGAPIPQAAADPGTSPTPAQMTEAARVAAGIRVGDSSGVAMPPGFTLRLSGVEGGMPDGLPFLRYLDEQIARGTLTSLLDLGSTANGSRALGDNFADVYRSALQAVADDVAETATRLAVLITDWNAGEDAPSPAVVAGDVGSNPRAMAESVASLVQQGAVEMDDDLQAWMRDALNLPKPKPRPKPAPPAPVPAPQDGEDQGKPVPPQPDAGQNPPAPGKEPVKAAAGDAWPYTRDLTPVEASAGLDPIQLDADQAAVLAGLIATWAAISDTQRGELAEQIAEAVDAGDLAALGALTVTTDVAAQAIAAALVKAASAGIGQATAEAASQGVVIPAGTASVDAVRLQTVADATAAVMGDGMASAAGREALRHVGAAAKGADVAAATTDYLSALGDTYLKDVLGGAVAGAVNEGRAAGVRAAGGGTRYFASAIRDAGTCAACAANDQRQYDTLEQAEADFPTGGYALCLGRERCRCVIITRYGDEPVDWRP